MISSTFKKRAKPRQVRSRLDSDDDEGKEAKNDNQAAADRDRDAEKAKAREREREKEKERERAREKEREKQRKAESKPKAALSFGGDEEEEAEAFKIKKSSASKRLAKETKERRKLMLEKDSGDDETAPATSGYYARAGDYTAESLRALKLDQASAAGGQGRGAGMGDEGSAMNATFVADANQIHEARKRREMARQLGAQGEAATDFIPLAAGAEPVSRRGVDNNADDDTYEMANEQRRIQFGDTRKIQRERAEAEMKMALEHEAEREDSASSDDEVRRWEREQIRKGGVRQPEPAAANRQQPRQATMPAMADDMPASAAGVIQQLRAQLAQAKAAHQETSEHASQLRQNVLDAESRMAALKQDQKTANDTYAFFEDMRSFIGVLIDCLDEKVPIIDAYEAEVHSLLKERADAVRQQWQTMQSDYLHEIDAMVPGQGFANGAAPQPPAFDEFGRDTSGKAVADRKERIRQRAERARGEALGYSSPDEHDELRSTQADFDQRLRDVIAQSGQVFADVDDKYSRLDVIAQRFARWKRKYPQAYADAFVSVCLPKLFVPFVRLQMLPWVPLQANCPDFEQMPWFGCMVEFGDTCVEENDEDVNLIPELISLVLMPKLLGMITHVWSPMSRRQTERLRDTLARLSDYPVMQPGAKPAMEVAAAITERLVECGRDDVVVPLLPRDRRADPACNSIVFRQLNGAVKAVVNMTMLRAYVSDVKLQDIVVENIINNHLLPVLAAYGPIPEVVGAAEQLVAAMPNAWLEDLAKFGSLAPLHRLKVILNQLLEQADTAGNTAARTTPGTIHDRDARSRLEKLANKFA